MRNAKLGRVHAKCEASTGRNHAKCEARARTGEMRSQDRYARRVGTSGAFCGWTPERFSVWIQAVFWTLLRTDALAEQLRVRRISIERPPLEYILLKRVVGRTVVSKMRVAGYEFGAQDPSAEAMIHSARRVLISKVPPDRLQLRVANLPAAGPLFAFSLTQASCHGPSFNNSRHDFLAFSMQGFLVNRKEGADRSSSGLVHGSEIGKRSDGWFE